MDPAVEGCGRNPVRLTPVEVCQSALAARLDQPELFLWTCAFPAHFRSLHILLFLRHRVSFASVILPSASLYVSTCLFGALTEYLTDPSINAILVGLLITNPPDDPGNNCVSI